MWRDPISAVGHITGLLDCNESVGTCTWNPNIRPSAHFIYELLSFKVHLDLNCTLNMYNIESMVCISKKSTSSDSTGCICWQCEQDCINSIHKHYVTIYTLIILNIIYYLFPNFDHIQKVNYKPHQLLWSLLLLSFVGVGLLLKIGNGNEDWSKLLLPVWEFKVESPLK